MNAVCCRCLGVVALGLSLAACISPREGGGADGTGGLGDGGDPSSADLVHSAGYAEASFHGIEANLQVTGCRDSLCHGDDLTGGASNVSCDTAGCHSAGWRSDCEFCHGGADSLGGAPPRDMDGRSDTASLSFRAHTSHVTKTDSPAFKCTQCHVDADRMLSPGHAFDDTPGRAEVRFTAGLSALGTYDGNGGCANLYCHGTGLSNGASANDDDDTQCDSCHAYTTSGVNAWSRMSGEHARHLVDNMVCGDCHTTVVDGSSNVINADLHVNGGVDLDMSADGLTYSGGQCTGFCHNEFHFYDTW